VVVSRNISFRETLSPYWLRKLSRLLERAWTRRFVITEIERAQAKKVCYQSLRIKKERVMAKTIARRKRVVRRDWTRAEVKELRQHSRDKTRVKNISRALKRTPGALRQKARALGIPLGHRRTKKKRAGTGRHLTR